MPGRVLGLKPYIWELAMLGLSYREVPSLTLESGLCSQTMRLSSGKDSSTWSLYVLLYEAGMVYGGLQIERTSQV